MPFQSILFDKPENHAAVDERSAPRFLHDLNLDQVIDSITAIRPEFDLQLFFFAPLDNETSINFRHEVFRDLDGQPLLAHIGSFAKAMHLMREYLTQAEALRYKYQKESWFLDAVDIYGAAVQHLVEYLTHADLRSRGLAAFRDYVTDYVHSLAFDALVADVKKLKEDLAGVEYCVHLHSGRVTVSKFVQQVDYSAAVNETFARFKQGYIENRVGRLVDSPGMNHVEASILDLVARLYPETFSSLDHFCEVHREYLDTTIARFDREIQFYVGYLEYLEAFKSAGLTFCYPTVSQISKEVFASDTFDLALANKLVPKHQVVVRNDFSLNEPERILIVTGPNQGGKTTLARTFGQVHFLANLGCPVPGTKARLFLFDQLFTHFEKEEDLHDLNGKLQEELMRVHEILTKASSQSIIVLNEIFTSTTLVDALFLGTQLLKQIIELDLLCVYVTFVEELTSLSQTTVSMVSMVSPENPAVRTHKVIRKPADGLAYAVALADKYGLTYDRLKSRIVS
jgi:DNA mismatch repair protein MutS